MPLGIIIPIPMVEHHSLIQTKIPTRESLVITAIIYPAIIPGLMLQSPLSWAAPAPRCAASSEASGWAPQVGKTSRGPVAPILAMTCWWHMGIFLGDWWVFFFMTFHRDFMGMSHLIFNGILLPIGDTWHLLKFGVSKGHSVGNQSNNLPFLELVAAFWLNWVRDGWRGVMFGFHFTFNVHSGWILLPCLGSTTSTLPWGCQFSQALAARKL